MTKLEIEQEIEVECKCPKCGHIFKHVSLEIISIEPLEREEDDR